MMWHPFKWRDGVGSIHCKMSRVEATRSLYKIEYKYIYLMPLTGTEHDLTTSIFTVNTGRFIPSNANNEDIVELRTVGQYLKQIQFDWRGAI